MYGQSFSFVIFTSTISFFSDQVQSGNEVQKKIRLDMLLNGHLENDINVQFENQSKKFSVIYISVQ
jgi:hypothetical protein